MNDRKNHPLVQQLEALEIGDTAQMAIKRFMLASTRSIQGFTPQVFVEGEWRTTEGQRRRIEVKWCEGAGGDAASSKNTGNRISTNVRLVVDYHTGRILEFFVAIKPDGFSDDTIVIKYNHEGSKAYPSKVRMVVGEARADINDEMYWTYFQRLAATLSWATNRAYELDGIVWDFKKLEVEG